MKTISYRIVSRAPQLECTISADETKPSLPDAYEVSLATCGPRMSAIDHKTGAG